jgi:peptide-methionine (S)-S-oxide reductase
MSVPLFGRPDAGFVFETNAGASDGQHQANEAVLGFLAADHIDEGRTAMSENTETAILAGGCFWPAQELLRHRDGVISTRVGYTGGENNNPTTDNHPGHAEAVEVTFDPGRTSYRAILEFYFQIHRPDLGEELVGSDYRSEIFYTSDEQRQVAEDTIADADASGLWHGKVVTKISEARRFWEAGAEDQNYLQHYPDGKNQFSP